MQNTEFKQIESISRTNCHPRNLKYSIWKQVRRGVRENRDSRLMEWKNQQNLSPKAAIKLGTVVKNNNFRILKTGQRCKKNPPKLSCILLEKDRWTSDKNPGRLWYFTRSCSFSPAPLPTLLGQAKKSSSSAAEGGWLNLGLTAERPFLRCITENYSDLGTKQSEKANVTSSVLLRQTTDQAHKPEI